jgi:hypothetical protein
MARLSSTREITSSTLTSPRTGEIRDAKGATHHEGQVEGQGRPKRRHRHLADVKRLRSNIAPLVVDLGRRECFVGRRSLLNRSTAFEEGRCGISKFDRAYALDTERANSCTRCTYSAG